MRAARLHAAPRGRSGLGRAVAMVTAEDAARQLPSAGRGGVGSAGNEMSVPGVRTPGWGSEKSDRSLR